MSDAADRTAQAATPMMRQYLETKARYPDALLFFRLGDFYELFFDDALTASEALQITLTARSKGDDKVPMCGVPHHAARGYVAKLLEKGFKVAICDQIEPPGKSQLVKREVTRVVTPGMVLDDQVLDPREASYLGAVALGDAGAGLALLDASTGELRVGEVRSDARLADELRRAGVRELVLAHGAEEAGLAGIEHLVVEDHAGRHHPGHLALHDGRLPRLLDLVADGDLEPLLQEARHVSASGVVGHPAHRDLVVPLRARRQRDLERLRGGHGVLEEHLVEVAEPEEEDGVRVPRLRLEVLAHHRGGRGGDIGHGER